MSLQFLIIDDEKRIYSLFYRFLIKHWPDADIVHYDPVELGIPNESYDFSIFDIVLIDYDLGLPDKDENGLVWLQFLRQRPDVPGIIFVTGVGNEEIAVKAIKFGADEYLNKQNLTYQRFVSIVKETMDFREQTRQSRFMTQTFMSRESQVESMSDVADEKTRMLSVTEIKKLLETSNGSNINGFNLKSGSSENLVKIPGYDIKQEIAQGGMSTVYLASNVHYGTDVVLKIVNTNFCHDPIVFKRFAREHTLISKLRHPNVVRIYERAFAKDYAYIALEYFPCGDLSKRIKKNGPIPPQKAMCYLKQMAKGLSAVHELGIVHRDLKPGNIIFREDDTLAITDFGIAKILDGAKNNITNADTILGTPYYMSPEQGEREQIDARADLYSLGAIFYEMLTGEKPYKSTSLSRLIYEHIHTPIPQLKGELEIYNPIIEGLLAKDPDDRFQNAHQLLVALDWEYGDLENQKTA
jgi:eukaryotic-like serine/threonine-protein kinase